MCGSAVRWGIDACLGIWVLLLLVLLLLLLSCTSSEIGVRDAAQIRDEIAGCLLFDAFELFFLCLLRNAVEGDLDGVCVRHEDDASEGVGDGDLEDEGEEDDVLPSLRLCTGTYSPAEEERDDAACAVEGLVRGIAIGLDIA